MLIKTVEPNVFEYNIRIYHQTKNNKNKKNKNKNLCAKI